MKNLVSISNEIASLTVEWEPILMKLTEDVVTLRKNSQNRSIKQIIGHLIDSATNNTHRIVHLHYQPLPLIFPNYATLGNNDRWIKIQGYQNEEWINLVQLCKYSLLHISHVIKNAEPDNCNNEWISGPGKTVTMEAMITDFPPHLKLHLSEINELIEKD